MASKALLDRITQRVAAVVSGWVIRGRLTPEQKAFIKTYGFYWQDAAYGWLRLGDPKKPFYQKDVDELDRMGVKVKPFHAVK